MLATILPVLWVTLFTIGMLVFIGSRKKQIEETDFIDWDKMHSL